MTRSLRQREADLMNSLGDRILFYRKLAIKEVPRTCDIAQDGHRRIVAAIRKGGSETGRAIATQSVINVFECLAEYLTHYGLIDN